MSFKEYLQTQGLYSYQKMNVRANQYKNWLVKNQQSLAATAYKDILNYIGYLQSQGKKPASVNDHLRAISHYYQYKKLPDQTYQIRVKNSKKPPSSPFTQTELNELYDHYQSTSNSYHRHSDKLILGLIIYQGLDQRDLLHLQLKDLQLAEGKIHIQAGRSKKNSRTLPLESHQIMPLHHYITHHRESENDKLFSRQCANLTKIHWQLKKLYQQVKTQGEVLELSIEKLGQLRQSRISHWIKIEGLRKAQYKAGFKQVSSAAVYQTENLENLQEQIRLYHPMR